MLRLLSSHSRDYSLSDLGMSEKDLAKVPASYNKSYGMILSTGPTGSAVATYTGQNDPGIPGWNLKTWEKWSIRSPGIHSLLFLRMGKHSISPANEAEAKEVPISGKRNSGPTAPGRSLSTSGTQSIPLTKKCRHSSIPTDKHCILLPGAIPGWEGLIFFIPVKMQMANGNNR